MFISKLKGFYKRLKFNFIYKKNNVYISSGSIIGLNNIFEGANRISRNTTFVGKIGYGSYIGENSLVNGKIGRFTSIASKVVVLMGIHPTSTFVSTHPTFYSLARQNGETFVAEQLFCEAQYADEENKYSVIIGNDVWIGHGVTIMGGIKIGDGAIVAAGSIVTKDVEPYSIVAGIPAKLVRKRFSYEQIECLLQFKWWEKPIDWIKKHACEFRDIESFVHKANEDWDT